MNIRKARASDADSIANFQIKMAFETEDLKLDSLIVQKGVQAVFDDPSKGEYWVAEDSDQVIASLLLIDEWSDWRNGAVKWIHSVYVVPDYRCKGVFRQMYAVLKKYIESAKNLRGLRLYVEKTNLHAQKVYQKLGMTNEHYHLYEWLKPQ